jgi:hypothetical protein
MAAPAMTSKGRLKGRKYCHAAMSGGFFSSAGISIGIRRVWVRAGRPPVRWRELQGSEVEDGPADLPMVCPGPVSGQMVNRNCDKCLIFWDLLARPNGFEPLTPRFVVWCSIQLSYGRLIPLPKIGPRDGA